MSDSNTLPQSQRFGFSTGALERSDFHSAVDWMRDCDMRTIELSALRFEELELLVTQLDRMDLDSFSYISFHAPSSFYREQEARVIELLQPVKQRNWNIVIHPDMIYTPSLWECFGGQLLIENMDRRKADGRTVRELSRFFGLLPEARLCLDVAHARQIDSTLFLLNELIQTFTDRIAEIHISELDSHCRHVPMSNQAVIDYKRFASCVGADTHVIIESMLDRQFESIRIEEFNLAQQAFEVTSNYNWDKSFQSDVVHAEWSERF
jgi:hypothetical protein